MKISRVLIAVTCLALLSSWSSGQEFGSELLREIKIRIQDSTIRFDQMKRRASHAEEEIKLLQELKAQIEATQSAETKLQSIDESDPDALEEAEQKLYHLELGVGRHETLLEVHEQKGELLDLLGELLEFDLESEIRTVEKLLKSLSSMADLIHQRYKAEVNNWDDELDQIEEQLEENLYDVERALEIVHLKLRLHWATEEGEYEEAEELESEIEMLQSREEESLETLELGLHALPIDLQKADLDASRQLAWETDIAPTLLKACGDCHNDDNASGELNLEALIKATPLVINRQRWLNVIQQIKVRSMPPPDEGEMPEADRITTAAWITRYLEEFDYGSVHRVGHEPARRLTREEYNNTIRDLIGIDLRPADQFPADLSASSGFKNSANSLFFQPLTLERFISAAEQVTSQAFPIDSLTQANQLKLSHAWNELLQDDANLSNPLAVIERFTSRAFRRPATQQEITDLGSLYQRMRQSGHSPYHSIREVIEVILISPHFLFRNETVEGRKKVTQFEMANRLSYFLWSSMPDTELFAAAQRGDLLDQGKLITQVDRMLDDPKAITLGTVFASQWLGTDQLDRVRPDPIDNPWATDGLVSAMTQETALLFHSLVRDNLPVDRLVDSNYTFMNQELAAHYGIEGVLGDEMRKVSLRNTQRSGLLAHGSVLAVTSFPGRVSPVMRGNWILTELLGTPPPPPPPNVSEFDESIAERGRLSQRQKLELHRNNPNCYSCHSQIDPLGFTLSRFDWFGRYRSGRAMGEETKGRLPDGREIDGLEGLIQAILEDRVTDLSRQTIKKLFSFALGRQLEYYDEATLRELMIDFEQDERRLRKLVHHIVQTDTFQMNETKEMGSRSHEP